MPQMKKFFSGLEMLYVPREPDFVIWDKKKMQCRIVEATVPLNEKQVKYTKLILHMKNRCNSYSFSKIVMAVGAMGAIIRIFDRNL